MKILITGNKGFIGSHLQSYLIKKGHTVYGLDIDNEPFFPDVDIVFHFAAMNGTNRFYTSPYQVESNDIQITLDIIERYKETDTKIVYSSSSELYNSSFELGLISLPFHEDSPVCFDDIKNPRWSYAIPKLVGETLLHNANQEYGTRYTILRYFNIYGPGQEAHFIPEFIERALNDEFYIIGNDARAFMYIDDAVQLTTDIVIGDLRSTKYSTYNVGNPFMSYTPLSIAEEIMRLLGKEGTVEILLPEGKEGSPVDRLPDTRRINSHIEKLTPIGVGISKTVEWYLENRK